MDPSFRVEMSLRVTRLGIFALVFSFIASFGLATYCVREVNRLARFDAISLAQQEQGSKYLRTASAFLHGNPSREEKFKEPVGAVQTEEENKPLLFVPPSFQQEPTVDAAEYTLEPVNAIQLSQLNSLTSSSEFLDFTGNDPNIQSAPYSAAVAVDPASGTYLLVWRRVHRIEPPLYDLAAQRVGANGQLLDAEPFPITLPQSREPTSPRLVFGHGMFFLTWYWSGGSGFDPDWNGVAAARIATDGTVLDLGGFEVARWSTETFCCFPRPSAPVVAPISNGFLLLWHHAFYSGGVSGGAVEIAGTLVSPGGDVGISRTFYIVQPSISSSFKLACKSNDQCVLTVDWRGQSPLFVFNAQEYLSDEVLWGTRYLRACERSPSPFPCPLPVVWDSGGRIDFVILPDGSFLAAWESIEIGTGVHSIMLRRISPQGELLGEPYTIPDSGQYHLPRFGASERLFFHSGNFDTYPYTNRGAFRIELDFSDNEISLASPITPLGGEPIEIYASGLIPACSATTCLAAWDELELGIPKLRAWHSSRNIRPTNEELAARFAPILIMDSEEKFLPISREDYLTVTDLKTRKVRFAGKDFIETIDTEVVLEDLVQPELVCPDGSTIKKAKERCKDWYYFLDVEGVEPSDFRAVDGYAAIQQTIMADGRKPTIYWHVTSYDETGETAVQYWFFYLYNAFTNKHESDWEQITLRLDSELNPLEVAYASHTSPGQKKVWAQLQDGIGRTSDHPWVYVADGSHASYFEPGEHPAIICPETQLIPGRRYCWETRSFDQNDGTGNILIVGNAGLENLIEDYDKIYVLDELENEESSSSYVFFDGDYSSGNYFQVIRSPGLSEDPRLRTEWNDPFSFVREAILSI